MSEQKIGQKEISESEFKEISGRINKAMAEAAKKARARKQTEDQEQDIEYSNYISNKKIASIMQSLTGSSDYYGMRYFQSLASMGFPVEQKLFYLENSKTLKLLEDAIEDKGKSKNPTISIHFDLSTDEGKEGYAMARKSVDAFHAISVILNLLSSAAYDSEDGQMTLEELSVAVEDTVIAHGLANEIE